MFRSNTLTGHLLAASAAGLLGMGVIGQVLAQDEDDNAPPAAQQNVDEQNEAAEVGPAADSDAPAAPAAQDDAQPQDNNAAQNDTAQNEDAAEKNAADNNEADDAPPAADDLNIDDERRDDASEPPAIPADNNLRDDRRDNDRGNIRRDEVRRDGNFRNDNFREDGISPSDRTFNDQDQRNDVRRDGRSNVRRFDYDDPSQPIPEDQVRTHDGNGCNPCAQRVYHNPCGGCGQSYGYSNNGGQVYQTQSQQPNRAVLGITIRDENDGTRVVTVVPNSPAAQAGVQVGDRIVSIGGKQIRNTQGLLSHMRNQQADRQIALTINRDGEQHELNTQLGRFAQVFPNDSQNGRSASQVPDPPQSRLVQNGENGATRVAARPNYDAARNDQERLDRVQLRIGQLENELTALRQEEQDLKNVVSESKEASSTDDDSTADDVTPPTDTPTPATDDNSDDIDNSDAIDDSSDGASEDAIDDNERDDASSDDAAQPTNRE